MKPIHFSLVMALALSTLPVCAAPQTARTASSTYTAPFMTPQTAWAANSLKQMQTIKVGMTRAQLMKVFGTEGGTFSRETQTFVYQGCPCFKVRVQFRTIGKSSYPFNPADKIKAISQPFLAWPVYN